MASRRNKGPICGVENCRSRLYEEGEDGFLYCQNGHRQGGLVRGKDDEDEYISAARKVTRKERNTDEQETGAARHLSGRRGFDLYLKCLQLILRHQIWFLVQEKGLPGELETVVFDLWALRVAQLGDRIVNGSLENDSQSQQFNTLESEDEATDGEQGTISTPKGRSKKLHGVPNLYDCLVLCYLGISTLRLPITPGDVYAWVTDGKMAYRGAIKLLPLAMRDRLLSSYHAMLAPQIMMSYKRFYATLTSLKISFETDHGVLWPALNVPLLLYRYIKELALPLELYDATLRLGNLLGHDFAFHHEGRHKLGIRHLPEAQLVGCLVLCVKLLYPFDKIMRIPKSSSEPTGIVMDWSQWGKHMRAAIATQRAEEAGFTTEELTKLQERDVFDMQPDQLDQYLDFYANTFIDDAQVQRTKDTDNFRNALYGMFPIDRKEQCPPIHLSDGLPHEQVLETVRAVHGSMKTQVAIDEAEAEADVLRPGQMYPVWKRAEELPKHAGVFFDEAARLAGLSRDMLVMAVFFTEARVERWRRKQREGMRGRNV